MDLNELLATLDNEEINIGLVGEDWEEPEESTYFTPQPGEYVLRVKELNDNTISTSEHRDIGRVINFSPVLMFVGGEYDGREAIKCWGRDQLNTRPRPWDGQSEVGDILMSAGLPANYKKAGDVVRALKVLAESGKPFRAKLDWKGECPECMNTILFKETGAKGKEGFDKAKGNYPLLDKVREAGLKIHSAIGFPKEGNEYKYSKPCTDCEGTVYARVYLKKFLAPVSEVSKTEFSDF